MQVRDHSVEDSAHPVVVDDPRATAGPVVVDQIEGPGRDIEHGGGAAADSGRHAAQNVNQGEERSGDQVTEEDVEQQLLVAPAGPVGCRPQPLLAGVIEQVMEACARPVEVVVNRRLCIVLIGAPSHHPASPVIKVRLARRGRGVRRVRPGRAGEDWRPRKWPASPKRRAWGAGPVSYEQAEEGQVGEYHAGARDDRAGGWPTPERGVLMATARSCSTSRTGTGSVSRRNSIPGGSRAATCPAGLALPIRRDVLVEWQRLEPSAVGQDALGDNGEFVANMTRCQAWARNSYGVRTRPTAWCQSTSSLGCVTAGGGGLALLGC